MIAFLQKCGTLIFHYTTYQQLQLLFCGKLLYNILNLFLGGIMLSSQWKDTCDYCHKTIKQEQLVVFQDFKVHATCQTGMLAKLRIAHPEVHDDDLKGW